MRFLIVLLIIQSIISCKTDKNKVKINKVLQERDTMSIPIKSDTNYFSWYTQVLEENDTTYIYRLEYFKDIIEVYNFDSKKLIREIILKTEGPNSVRDLQASTFHFYSKDSFLFANRHGEIYRMLNDSVLMKKNISKQDEYATVFGDNARKMIISNNEIFLRHVAYIDTSTEKFNNSSILVKYNLQSNESSLCNVSISKKYSNRRYKYLNPNFKSVTYTYNERTNKILLSNTVFPEIYEYDIEKNLLINEYSAKCSKIDAFSVPSKKNLPYKEFVHYYLTNGLYLEFIYDSYRDIYYRFVALPVPEYKESMQRWYLHQPYVIMVLDNQFNILTEREFPQYRFNVKDWFITKEGLWVSNNNPFNAIFDENKISFTLLTVEDYE